MNFEDNFNELGNRFLEYLKYKGLKGKDVAEVSKNSASQISNIIKGKVFGCDKLFKILNNYTDLNANWLFTGNGQMINKPQNNTLNSEKTTFKEDLNTNIELLSKQVENVSNLLASKQETIETQKELINNLKAEIQRLNT
jgi:transcriptional regulator with XRE-family HTH domain